MIDKSKLKPSDNPKHRTNLPAEMDVEEDSKQSTDEVCAEEVFRELMEPIASFLDVSSVGKLLQVCRRMHCVPSQQRVWKALAEKTFVEPYGVCFELETFFELGHVSV